MRPDRDSYLAPGQVDIRVMPLLFRQDTDSIRESQSIHKIVELKEFLQVMIFHHLPTIA